MDSPGHSPLRAAYWVVAGRFMAGAYPAILDPQQSRARLAALLEAGFDTFFDLTREDELPPYLPDLLAEAHRYGHQVRYRRFPIGDFGLPTRNQMADTLDAIDAALAEGRKVYLHCRGGIGRTGTTVGCYLVRHGLGGGQALDRLMELYRTTEQSLVHPRSPETDAQAEFVRAWQERG